MKRLISRLPIRNILRFAAAPVVLALVAGALSAQTVEELRLTVGKSIVLDYPGDIRQISTSDPAIVDAVAVSTREILLNAKAAGSATVVVWARTGQRTIYNVNIEQNLEPLRRLLKDTFPTENIQVQSSRDSIALTGGVSTKEIAERALAIVAPFGKSIVNNLKIAPLPVDKQILLRVRFAELNRNAATAFGINLVSTGATNTIGSISTGQFQGPRASEIGRSTTFSLTDALNIFAFRPDLDLAVLIKALQNQGILQIIAEPNLVTTNGKEASFLVGGEFPVPVLQGGGNAGAVTIQFREFGIRLTFNPSITENGTVKMYVKPEVSTIDIANGVTMSGFLIPALATRRMETNVELGPGQSFVIGGLIDDRVQETLAKIPGLSSIPLLGTLFKSREERKNKTELVVMVTPEITKPLEPGESAPIPVMPREFMAPLTPVTPTDKRSSKEPANKPQQQAQKEKATPKKAKGFFAKKG